jgi:sulfoxide reductase heme-binding subunit YedZ
VTHPHPRLPGRRPVLTRAVTLGALTAGVLLLLAAPALADPVLAHPVVHAGRTVVLAQEGGIGPDAELRKEAALAGYLSYGLMAMTVVWGILLTTGWARAIVRRSTVYSGHLAIAIAAQAFGLIHAVSYVLQTQTHFSVVMAIVPFAGGGEPEVAFGIIGLELTIAASIAVTLIHKLNYRRFRKVHIIGTYLGFALSWLHVLATSAEAKSLGLLGLTIAAILLVIIFAVLRVLPASRRDVERFALTATDPTAPVGSTAATTSGAGRS